MSKISKKLLSLAIVLAMVLSMTPVISFPAAADAVSDLMGAAATKKANVDKWVADNAAAFATGENLPTDCPACGESGITWVAKTAGNIQSTTDSSHFYLADNVTYNSMNMINVTSGSGKMCLHINGKTMRCPGRARVANEVHIFGNGRMEHMNTKSDGTTASDSYLALAMFPMEGKTNLNIYDGTYVTQHSIGMFSSSADQTSASVNLYGGTFLREEGSNTGTIFEMNKKYTVNMFGGAVSGGTGYVLGNGTDEATGNTVNGTSGGNVYMNAGTFNMYGGSISGGIATGVKTADETFGSRGGNVYIGTNATFNMYGGSIYGGECVAVNGAATYGGNVMLYPSTARLNMSGNAEIYGGQAKNGGNVQLRSSNEMTMSGNAKVYNGVANTGGNIYLMNGSNPKLTMSGNALVYGGTQPSEEEGVPGDASNIRMYGGTLIMKGNAIVRGGAKSGSAISVHPSENPLVVLMDNATVKNETGTSSRLINDGRILITEGWEGEAYAALINAEADIGYTYGEQIPTTSALRGTYNEETGEVTATDATFTGKLYVSSNNVEALADPSVTGGIVLAEEPATNEPVFGTFNPAGCEGMAYCEACYKQAKAVPGTTEEQAKAAALKEWTPYEYQYCENTSGNYKNDTTHEHLYLTEDLPAFDHSRLVNIRKGVICFNLNGKSVSKDPSATRAPLFHINGADAVLNIVDEKMEGQGASVMVGIAPTTITRGGAIWVQAGTANLYGGTYQDAAPMVDGALGNMIFRTVSATTGGTLNMYEGAKIDGSAIDSTRQTVYIEGGTFHMHGGEIVGRAKMSGSNGGSVYVTNKDDAVGTFTMSGGVIRDGVAGNPDDPTETLRNGGNVAVASGASFTMTGGEIYGGYATGTNGNVNIADDATFTKSGDAKIYSFTVETAAGREKFASFVEALANYQVSDAAYIGVWDTAELQLTEDAYVALMTGATATVSGAYKLYAMDTTQDDYAGTAYDWTVAEETEVVRDVKNPVNGNRYLNMTTAVGEGNETINSTRLDLALSTVTLRAGKTSEGMGLYYKARMSMSEALAAKVTTYGVVLSLKNMPYANFAEEGKENGFTAIEEKLGVNAENGYTVTVNSGSVFGIMKEDAEKAADNAQRGKMPIFANAYLEIDLNADGVKEYVMADTDETTAGDVAWSLYDVLATIDGRWSEFAAAQEKVTAFYSYWAQYGMDAWTFENIKKA